MLKKMKCLEASSSATAAESCHTTLAVSSNSHTISSNTLSYVKLIKTEPIDLEMTYVESCELKPYRLDGTSSEAAKKPSETLVKSSAASSNFRNPHLQIQTVPPRQPGISLLTNANSMQKIILTPRVDSAPTSATSTSHIDNEMGTIMRHVYAQQSNNGRNQAQPKQSSATNAHICPHLALPTQSSFDSMDEPRVIVTRNLPASAAMNAPMQRRHSASPHYQRVTPIITTSNNNVNASHQHSTSQQLQQHQYTSSSSFPQEPSPPPLSLQNHVRVIRDGRLYEESATSEGILHVQRNSLSPPPLLHHHQSRSAPNSPLLPRRYSVSPRDSPAAMQSQQNSAMEHAEGRLQRIMNNKDEQHLHISDGGSADYLHRNVHQHSPPLPPPAPPLPHHSSTHNMNALPVFPQAMTKPSLTSCNQSQSFALSPSTRKFIPNNARQTGPGQVPVNGPHKQQLQHNNLAHNKNLQQQRYGLSQLHEEEHSSSHSATTTATGGPMPPALSRSFRIPVVTNKRFHSSGNHDPQTAIHSTQSNTAMRPPPPPPPPKSKTIVSSSVGLSSNCNGSGLNVSCHSNEEPSSSIPDLEFDGTTVLCRVCGDKASGFHYGVHSCEGCKGFFRRSIQQKIQYRPCTKNQQCSILRINRNRCQYCRLKKCIAVGMSRDAVRFGRVPKREKARILAAMQQSTQNRGQQRALAGELDDQPRLIAAVLRAHLETCEFTKEKVATMRQRARECPSYSMPTLLACPLNPAPELQSEQEFSQRFAHVIRGVIDFAGMIPGFQLLTQDDKFTLLKAGLFDALFVRLICMFDSSINSIICLNGQVMRRDAIQNGANARFLVDSTFNFAERMNSMNLSDAEIGLFCAIVLITPDRPGLRNVELIEKMYSRLKGCLQKVISQNRADQPDFMSKLLETMPDLRTLSTLHTEKLVVFRTEHKELLRQQMWTVDDERPMSGKSPVINWDDPRMDIEAKSPLGSVSSTESGDLEYSASSTMLISSHQNVNQQQAPQPSSLASSAPLLAATLSGTCPLRNRANSGSSGDSTAEMDIVGSHAHLTQNGLTITPIARTHSHQQLHHHLTTGAPTNRYRKLDSPTDSGIESGNEKTECGIKAVSSGGSSSCSSPRSSVDDTLECTDASAASASASASASSQVVTISVSPIRSPQPVTPTSSTSSSSSSLASSSTAPTSAPAPANTPNTLKRQIVEDMPVLKRVLQAPPLYDTNSLMDEAYKPHKKFRALRHREIETAEADASSTSNGSNCGEKAMPANTHTQTGNSIQNMQAAIPATNSPPPASQPSSIATTSVVVAQSSVPPSTSPNPPNGGGYLPQNQLQGHTTRQISANICSSNSNEHPHPHPHTNSNNGIIQPQQQQQQSLLSSTHSVLAKSLMAEPRMTPEQVKRSDIIQNYIMRDSGSLSSPASRSPAPAQHLAPLNQSSLHYNAAAGASPTSACSNASCASPSTTTITLASPPPPPSAARWQGHSVITTTNISNRQESISSNCNGSTLSPSPNSCQYFQAPHSTSISVSPPRPSPTAMRTPPRLLELQVDIADSQQPLNLSKKSPTPPPSKMQTLVAAATAVQRYPNMPSVEVTITPSSSADAQEIVSSVPVNSSAQQLQAHKVMLEA